MYSSVNIRIECRSAADDIFREILFFFLRNQGIVFEFHANSLLMRCSALFCILHKRRYKNTKSCLLHIFDGVFRLLPG